MVGLEVSKEEGEENGDGRGKKRNDDVAAAAAADIVVYYWTTRHEIIDNEILTLTGDIKYP